MVRTRLMLRLPISCMFLSVPLNCGPGAMLGSLTTPCLAFVSVVTILLQVLPCPTDLLLHIIRMVFLICLILRVTRCVRFPLKQTPIGPRKTKLCTCNLPAASTPFRE